MKVLVGSKLLDILLSLHLEKKHIFDSSLPSIACITSYLYLSLAVVFIYNLILIFYLNLCDSSEFNGVYV